MDDIDEYARRLAERTRARSKNFHHKTAEPPPAKRSLTADDLNCGSDGATGKKASPPKRQCLGDEKENVAAHSPGLSTSRRSTESVSALGPKNSHDLEGVAAPRRAVIAEGSGVPRGLAALRRRRDVSPDSGCKESQQALRQAALAADDGFTRTPRGLAALRRRQQVSPEPDAVPSSMCVSKPSSPAKVESKPKQLPGSREAGAGSSLRTSERKNNWDPKEAQGFTKSPSASKLSYSFKSADCHEVPASPARIPTREEMHEGPSTIPAPPPLPPPMPSPKASGSVAAKVDNAKKTVAEKVAVSNAVTIHRQPLGDSCQGGVPQRQRAELHGRDPSELSLQQRRALFEAAVVAEEEEQPCAAPEKLTVAQRKALFEQQMKLSKAAAERSYPVVKQGKPLKKPVGNEAKSSVAQIYCEKVTVENQEQNFGVAERRARLEGMAQNKELTPEYHSFKNVTLRSAVNHEVCHGQSSLHSSNTIKGFTQTHVSIIDAPVTDFAGSPHSSTSEEFEGKSSLGNDSASEDDSDPVTSGGSPTAVQASIFTSAPEDEENMDESGLGRSWEQTSGEAEGAIGKRFNESSDLATYDQQYAHMKALEEEIAREKAVLTEDRIECTEERSHREADTKSVSSDTEHIEGALKKEVLRNRLYPELPPMEWNDVPVAVPPPKPRRAAASPEDGQPLVHTQSVYRRKVCTPLRQLEQSATPGHTQFTPAAQTSNQMDIQLQIKALYKEAEAQEVVIAQASRALEVCRLTTEFLGSAEQVEGERLLLLATERRQACLAEVERLKTRGGCGDDEVVPERASLTLSQLQLPLKREFLAAQLEGILGEDVHYFLCLISHGAQVLASQMLSTADNAGTNALCFSNHMTLRDLRADFAVKVHVYALQTKKETLPHHRKYRIGGKDGKHKLTPKGSSKGSVSKSALSPATVCAPSGSALRTPSFGLVGSLQLTVANCRRSKFNLEKVPPHSPLEGTLLMQLTLRPEHHHELRGFLSMFEEVGGFGAWHRRWCVLAENRLSYWRYPEDESSKEPVGRLELTQCTSPEARLASRDICARPHTLILHINGKDYLLSADTKEERQNWCSNLTTVLKSLRTWAGMVPN
ncbi:uncharacterized protein LOC144114855 isoform X2 [Amblyomma americanum]